MAFLTLARVAGTLLVYQIEDTEPEEIKWFNTQVQQLGLTHFTLIQLRVPTALNSVFLVELTRILAIFFTFIPKLHKFDFPYTY
ncbi:hypothetical protein [Tolypothrix sp. NIES-4075]|uniref:hypothetical protein n=1 Tax=Tolypothrix sp. NIES-4075 TaxID=2005459 RepID=UPI000B5CB038|nr:hypothetical protein [Tolypothrix sp. NIES-4075]